MLKGTKTKKILAKIMKKKRECSYATLRGKRNAASNMRTLKLFKYLQIYRIYFKFYIFFKELIAWTNFQKKIIIKNGCFMLKLKK